MSLQLHVKANRYPILRTYPNCPALTSPSLLPSPLYHIPSCLAQPHQVKPPFYQSKGDVILENTDKHLSYLASPHPLSPNQYEYIRRTYAQISLARKYVYIEAHLHTKKKLNIHTFHHEWHKKQSRTIISPSPAAFRIYSTSRHRSTYHFRSSSYIIFLYTARTKLLASVTLMEWIAHNCSESLIVGKRVDLDVLDHR